MNQAQQPLTPFSGGEKPRMLTHGLYLTFEGPECSGKTTQLHLLQQRLAAEGYPILIAKQPGGTEVGAAIRRTLLNPEIRAKFLPKTESLLYWADRYQIYETIVKPAIAAKSVVFGDRDFDSSWAFQCFARGIDQEWMQAVQDAVIADFKPKKTILFLIPLKTIMERRHVRLGVDAQTQQEQRLGEADREFHETVIAGYKELAKREPNRFVIIDATKSVAAVHEETYALVKKLLHDYAEH